MYFKDFPDLFYDFKYGNTNETKVSIVKDITRNIRFRKEIFSNVTLYDEYDIKDGETPEIIAEKVYGNPNYHWIIMLANEKYDRVSDFPLDAYALDSHVQEKYNPELNSTAGDWYFSGGKIWFKVANPEDAFNPLYLTAPVSFTVTGQTSESGEFSISKVWGTSDSGIDYDTQEFWVKTTITGTPTGDLTITTTGREHNPVYWVNEDGFKILANDPGVKIPVTGVEEAEIINESKRRIKLISPDVVSVILRQYKELL